MRTLATPILTQPATLRFAGMERCVLALNLWSFAPAYCCEFCGHIIKINPSSAAMSVCCPWVQMLHAWHRCRWDKPEDFSQDGAWKLLSGWNQEVFSCWTCGCTLFGNAKSLGLKNKSLPVHQNNFLVAIFSCILSDGSGNFWPASGTDLARAQSSAVRVLDVLLRGCKFVIKQTLTNWNGFFLSLLYFFVLVISYLPAFVALVSAGALWISLTRDFFSYPGIWQTEHSRRWCDL